MSESFGQLAPFRKRYVILALLGLVGIAVAGTAFVGNMLPDEEDNTDKAFDEMENDANDEDTPDLLASIPFDDPVEDTTPFETAQTTAANTPAGVNNAAVQNLAPAIGLTGGVVESVGETLSDPFDLVEDVVETVGNTADTLILAGGGGDDLLTGELGDDYLTGGAGDDSLTGGDGIDEIHGGAGEDMINGDDGDDTMFGYIGDDVMSGGTGNDRLIGGDGDDAIHGGTGDDQLNGGYGDDTLVGGAGRDNIQGSEGDDIIDGVSGEDIAEKDYLNGSEGNDTLIGNNGDVMSGGDGADRFEITSGTVSIMDYADDDLLVLSYEGDVPVLTTETTTDGTMLLANGQPVASLFGVTTFDIGDVQMVAA
ncbi:calcium-binding protein [Octadecabacter sp. G9-8]|uniref:Calcium-binding protein n=1 Tax=Octadecabacter dasysiphoniae TaxID=2909341 RepID=A0ABS9CY13_9RHOB|nr:calcium-binding protein [Octadecabacter dasysiphoniae]